MTKKPDPRPKTDQQILEKVQDKGPKASPYADDQMICFCHSVTAGRIREEIRSGATTLYDLKLRTMAATGCGGCEWELLDLLNEL